MAFVRQVVAVIATLLALTAFAGPAPAVDLDRAWQSYLDGQTAIEPAYRFPHGSCFAAAAAAYDLPRTLLLAVARGESDFEVTARSRANAHGVMQILWPTTAQHLGIYRLSQLYDPCTNIDAGARYLRELLETYDGNLHLALAAYNYGPQRIAKDGRDIPRGANWYSGYIYRHLQYVLGNGTRPRPVNEALYSELGQSTLVTFGEPYRAEAFVARLEAAAPSLSLDWFRRGTGEFEVVMTYADREEFDRAAARLAEAGFRLAP
ncbi:MAG: lytic transglycosylase domain-containing protein [Woeseiaceae bacterium]|nr:lytic transglycosylase domain-containing protein [Woeseiaceae bacterium]